MSEIFGELPPGRNEVFPPEIERLSVSRLGEALITSDGGMPHINEKNNTEFYDSVWNDPDIPHRRYRIEQLIQRNGRYVYSFKIFGHDADPVESYAFQEGSDAVWSRDKNGQNLQVTKQESEAMNVRVVHDLRLELMRREYWPPIAPADKAALKIQLTSDENEIFIRLAEQFVLTLPGPAGVLQSLSRREPKSFNELDVVRLVRELSRPVRVPQPDDWELGNASKKCHLWLPEEWAVEAARRALSGGETVEELTTEPDDETS